MDTGEDVPVEEMSL